MLKQKTKLVETELLRGSRRKFGINSFSRMRSKISSISFFSQLCPPPQDKPEKEEATSSPLSLYIYPGGFPTTTPPATPPQVHPPTTSPPPLSQDLQGEEVTGVLHLPVCTPHTLGHTHSLLEQETDPPYTIQPCRFPPSTSSPHSVAAALAYAQVTSSYFYSCSCTCYSCFCSCCSCSCTCYSWSCTCYSCSCSCCSYSYSCYFSARPCTSPGQLQPSCL